MSQHAPAMALALADSLANAGWDLNDQVRRYVAWWTEGNYSVNGRCFDIGIATRAALGRFTNSGDALSSGDPSESASGNGSIMRLAPVPMRYARLFPDSIGELARLATESSLTTHASEQCCSACRYMALVLVGLLHDIDRDVVLAPDWEPLVQLAELAPLHPAIAEVTAGSFRHKQPPEIKGSGWVVKSLEAALWAFHRAGSFEEASKQRRLSSRFVLIRRSNLHQSLGSLISTLRHIRQLGLIHLTKLAVLIS